MEQDFSEVLEECTEACDPPTEVPEPIQRIEKCRHGCPINIECPDCRADIRQKEYELGVHTSNECKHGNLKADCRQCKTNTRVAKHRMKKKAVEQPAVVTLSLKDWADKLPKGYKTKFLKNCKDAGCDLDAIAYCSSLSHIVHSKFAWVKTPEGHDYWNTLYTELCKNDSMPTCTE